jgi:heme/copper-type cytochrome/quinol oxidase subunit 1
MSGRLMSEKIGHWHFWLFFIGFNATFLPMHWLGIEGMPRWVATYDPQFTFWNQFASAGYAIQGISIILFVANVVWSARFGKKSGANPWGARTLEWQIPSPPNYYNFKNIPTVYGLPYDFSQPLPYKGLDDELTDAPPALLAGHH